MSAKRQHHEWYISCRPVDRYHKYVNKSSYIRITRASISFLYFAQNRTKKLIYGRSAANASISSLFQVLFSPAICLYHTLRARIQHVRHCMAKTILLYNVFIAALLVDINHLAKYHAILLPYTVKRKAGWHLQERQKSGSQNTEGSVGCTLSHMLSLFRGMLPVNHSPAHQRHSTAV